MHCSSDGVFEGSRSCDKEPGLIFTLLTASCGVGKMCNAESRKFCHLENMHLDLL